MFKYGGQHTALGLALMELMIALSLGLLLIGVLMEMYITTQRSFQLQLSLNEMQSKAKIAIKIMADDIHQAGYIGCPKLTNDFPLRSYPPYSLTLANKLLVSVDAISISHAAFPSATLEENNDYESVIFVSNNVRFHSGDILTIVDCEHGEIFQVERVSVFGQSQKIQSSSPLHYKYKKNAEVSHLVINKYFVDKTDRFNRDGNILYALYVEDIKQYQSELVEGVSSIHFRPDAKGVAVDLMVESERLKKTWYAYESTA